MVNQGDQIVIFGEKNRMYHPFQSFLSLMDGPLQQADACAHLRMSQGMGEVDPEATGTMIVVYPDCVVGKASSCPIPGYPRIDSSAEGMHVGVVSCGLAFPDYPGMTLHPPHSPHPNCVDESGMALGL